MYKNKNAAYIFAKLSKYESENSYCDRYNKSLQYAKIVLKSDRNAFVEKITFRRRKESNKNHGIMLMSVMSESFCLQICSEINAKCRQRRISMNETSAVAMQLGFGDVIILAVLGYAVVFFGLSLLMLVVRAMIKAFDAKMIG